MPKLLECPDCQRHLRSEEERCPFCARELPLAHKLALTLAAATAAATGVACSQPVPIYGATPAPTGATSVSYPSSGSSGATGTSTSGTGTSGTGTSSTGSTGTSSDTTGSSGTTR